MKQDFISKKYSWTTILNVLIEVNYLTLIFLTPLWFAYFFPTFYMFEFNKFLVFRFFLGCLLFFTTWRLVISKKDIWARLILGFNNKIFNYFIIPGILLVGLYFLLPFSINPIQSFFGSMERQQGLFSYTLYFLWAFLMFFNLWLFSNKNNLIDRIKRILTAITISSLLVSIYGILQILNIDFIPWPEPPYLTGRTLSTFGQPNFLASFLLLTIPLGFYLAHVSRKFFIKFLYYLIAAIQLICLFFTSSRGGLIAFFVMLFVFAGYLFLNSNFNKKIKIFIILGVLFSFIFSVVAIEYVIPGRLRSSFDVGRGSLAARVYFFQASANAILQKPITGYGLENSANIFIKYYERDWALFGDVSANTDRAHNIVLDIMITSGFVGLVLFSLWYYYYFRLAWKQSLEKENQFLALTIFLGAFAYFISLLFSFTIVVGEIYFWLFFVILILIDSINNSPDKIENKNNKISFLLKIKWPLFFLIIILTSWQTLKSGQSLKADYYLNEIQKSINDMEFIKAAVLREEAASLKISSVQLESIDYFLYNHLATVCFYEVSRDKSEEVIINKKINEAVINIRDFGYKNIFLKAKLFACLNNEEQASKYFDLLTELAPNWPLGYLERGHYLVRLGKMKEAEKYYQLVDINLPDLQSPVINNQHKEIAANYKYLMYVSLGNGYLKQGNYDRAELFFQAAYKQKARDYSILKKIADTYYLRGDFDTALQYVKRGARANPSDYNWWLAMAMLYFELEEKSEGLDSLQKAWLIAPEAEKDNLEDLIWQYTNNK